MGVLHMEPEQVRAVAQQLNMLAASIKMQAQNLSRASFGMDWSGGGRDAYVAEMYAVTSKLTDMSDAAGVLSQRVQREVDEWVYADNQGAANMAALAAVIQDARAGIAQWFFGSQPGQPEAPPTDMAGLYKRIAQLPPERPIEILQIGENEYLVLFDGTEWSYKGGGANNWGGAFENGGGLPGDYERQAYEIMMKNIPPGAKVHLAGYSQGGIIAMNLADLGGVQDRFDLESVTTFGSPISSPKYEGADYYNFAAIGDKVPMLDRNGLLCVPLAVASVVMSMTPSALQQTQVDGGKYTIGGSHGSYGDAPALKDADTTGKLPFEIDQQTWDGNWDSNNQRTFETKARTGLTYVELNLTSNDPWQRAQGVVDLLIEAPKQLVLARANTVIDATAQTFFPGSYDAIDGYMDRLNYAVMDTPTLTQSIGYVYDATADVAGDVVNAIGDGVQNLADGAGNFIGGLFD